MPDDALRFLPLFNTVVTFAVLVGLVHLVASARGWTLPVQDAKLRLLSRRVDEADLTARRADDSARIAHDAIDTSVRELTKEFARVHSRLDDLTMIRESARIMEDRVDASEQTLEQLKAQIASLRCAEVAWHETEKPGYCPLHNTDCPLEVKAE